jgi:hypothetical protein
MVLVVVLEVLVQMEEEIYLVLLVVQVLLLA